MTGINVKTLIIDYNTIYTGKLFVDLLTVANKNTI